MTTYLALWPAPHPLTHGELIDTIVVERAPAQAGPYAPIATLVAEDPYGNWVTHHEDAAGTATSWYRAVYMEAGQAKGQSVAHLAELALEVTPQHIIDNMQGLPLNWVDSRFIQSWIKWAVEAFEAETGMLLSVATATKEIHDYKVFQKILGDRQGNRIRLRRHPVVEVQNVYYRIRGVATSVQDTEWTGLDLQVEYNSHPDGYNPGIITVYPRVMNVRFYEGALLHESRMRNAVNVLFTYTHGFATWPRQVNELIMRYAAADVMEVAGQSETAGLSSRSIDGYSEAFTASATTTTLSAMRMYYKKEIQRLANKWKKPIFG